MACFPRFRSQRRAAIVIANSVAFLLLVLLLLVRSTNAQSPPPIIDALSRALLDDLIPPSSDRCISGGGGTTTVSLTYTPDPRTDWDVTAQPLERDLFLFQMAHNEPDEDGDDNTDNSTAWQIRVGRGSNLYSFIGTGYGESVPPQYHPDGEFVDEVWQNVVLADSVHRPDAPFFVHQAGTYSRGNDRDDPFFAPNVAYYCDAVQCSTASWGQQAHLPTKYDSSALYLNRYRDCGNGVIELTSIIHNMPYKSAVPFTYSDTPWGGVRTSALADLLVSNVTGPGAWHMTDLWPWGEDRWLPGLSETGGYTAFAQRLPRPLPPFVLPADLSLQSLGACQESGGHTVDHGIYTVWCKIRPTAVIAAGERTPLTLTNPATGGSIAIAGIHHWAWEGDKLFLYPLVGAAEMNAVFPANATMTVSYRDVSMPIEDNMALSLVHGTFPPAPWDKGWSPRLRMGYAGTNDLRRDYTVFAVNTMADIRPGQSYVQRQFMLTDRYVQIDDRSRTWSNETMRDLWDLSDTAVRARAVRLYLSSSSSSDESAGALLTVQIEPNQCSSQAPACVGATVPGPDHPTAYFAITCRGGGADDVERYYVGADLYHFSPADDPDNVRSWSCGGGNSSSNDTAEPTWKLLGYFPEDSGCPTALAAAKFAGYDCPAVVDATTTNSLRATATLTNGNTMDHTLVSFIRVVTRVMSSLSSSASNNNNNQKSSPPSSGGESLRATRSAESSSQTAGDPVVVATTSSSSGGRGWSGTILLYWTTIFLVCFVLHIE